MIKNNNGITLIALIITIIILLIISAVVIKGSMQGINETQSNKSESELKMVQHSIVERYTKYKLTKDEELLVGDSIENSSALPTLSDGNTWKITSFDDNSKKYYNLKIGDLDKLGLNNDNLDTTNGNANDNLYIVNYYSGEVYSYKNKLYKSFE